MRQFARYEVVMWAYLPVIVLEQIYALLSLTDRYACSRVCRHWLDVFRSARLWRHLNIGRRTFTRRKLRTAYLRATCHQSNDDEYEINHWRFQMYLGVFGHHCRRLTFQPIEHFYNLFEFLRVSKPPRSVRLYVFLMSRCVSRDNIDISFTSHEY